MASMVIVYVFRIVVLIKLNGPRYNINEKNSTKTKKVSLSKVSGEEFKRLPSGFPFRYVNSVAVWCVQPPLANHFGLHITPAVVCAVWVFRVNHEHADICLLEETDFGFTSFNQILLLISNPRLFLIRVFFRHYTEVKRPFM